MIFKRRIIRKYVFNLLLLCIGLIFIFPFVYSLTNSFMNASELNRYYAGLTNPSKDVSMHMIPEMVSLEEYYNVFLSTPDYLIKFWNSLLLSISIVVGQIIISVLGGYAFAKFRFPFKEPLFFLYIVVMMLPLQVTLVPNFIVLNEMGLVGNPLSIILPSIFGTFGVFLLRKNCEAIPNAVVEAAKMDGANQFKILRHIVFPYCKGGIASLAVLCFIDSWSMVEQPMIFLRDSAQYPLSLFLANVTEQNMSIAFACSFLAMAPAVLLFLFFEDEMITGIGYMGLQ